MLNKIKLIWRLLWSRSYVVVLVKDDELTAKVEVDDHELKHTIRTLLNMVK